MNGLLDQITSSTRNPQNQIIQTRAAEDINVITYNHKSQLCTLHSDYSLGVE